MIKCGSAPNRSRRTSLLTLASLAMLLAPLPGCQSITGSPSVAQVRIVDATPYTPGIDVYQGTGILAYNLGLGTITSYVQINPGNYSIAVDLAGTRQQLAVQNGTFLTNSQYTVLVGTAGLGLQELILKDQTQAAPSGQVALRILDQSDTAGPVDLYLIPTGSTILTVKPLLTGVTFGSNTGYVDVPSGTYTLVALPAGTTPTATGTTFYTGAAVSYASGSAKTLIIIDQQLVTIPGVQVITANDYDPVGATS